MTAKIVPTDDQAKQLNIDRLISIFKLPPEYFVNIVNSKDPFAYEETYLTDITYVVYIGKSPSSVSVPANNHPGWFSKKTFKTVTRYAKVAGMCINPYNSQLSAIQLTGNEAENKQIAALIDKASRNWIFRRGETKDIELDINVFPESEFNYFDID